MADNMQMTPQEEKLVQAAGYYLIVEDAIAQALEDGREEATHPKLKKPIPLIEAHLRLAEQQVKIEEGIREYYADELTPEDTRIALQSVLDDLALREDFPAGKVHLEDLKRHTAAKLLEYGVDGVHPPRDIGPEAVDVDEIFTRAVARSLQLEYPEVQAMWLQRTMIGKHKEALLAEMAEEQGVNYHVRSQELR